MPYSMLNKLSIHRMRKTCGQNKNSINRLHLLLYVLYFFMLISHVGVAE